MTAAAPKLAFDNGGAFIRGHAPRGRAVPLAGEHADRGAAIQLYAKAPIALALTAVSWSVLIFLQPGVARRRRCASSASWSARR